MSSLPKSKKVAASKKYNAVASKKYYERYEFKNFPLCVGKGGDDLKFIDSTYYTDSLKKVVDTIKIDNFGNIIIKNIDPYSFRKSTLAQRQQKPELKKSKNKLGEGGYGIVYRFSIDGQDFVIKQTQDSHELNVIKTLQDLDNDLFYSCRIIPVEITKYTIDLKPFYNSADTMYSNFCELEDEKGLEPENNLIKKEFCDDINYTINKFKDKYKSDVPIYFILLPLMDGSLNDISDYLSEVSLVQKLNILRIITNYVYCLYTQGYYYTDIKLENVLYKCIGENHILLFLGDIGSIFTKEESDMAIGTFFPFEDIKHFGANSLTLIWALHIMFLALINEKCYKFVYKDNIEDLKDYSSIASFIYQLNIDNNFKSFLIDGFKYCSDSLLQNKKASIKIYKEKIDNFYDTVSESSSCSIM